MSLALRIQELMRDTGWNVSDIASHAGLSVQAVSQWRRGKAKSMKIKFAMRIAQHCPINPIWLASGIGEKRLDAIPRHAAHGSRDAGTSDLRVSGTVVIDTGQELVIEHFFEGPSGGWTVGPNARPGARALLVRGQGLFPAVRSGWFLVLEPVTVDDLRGGDLVLIKQQDDRHCLQEIVALRGNTADVLSIHGQSRNVIMLDHVQRIERVSSMLAPGSVASTSP